MGQTVTAPRAAAHLLTSEMKPTMAKADLRKTEIADWRTQVGRAIERARLLSGLSLKEFADVVQRDDRQVARWIAGSERPQLDALFASPVLRQPLVVAFAEMAGQGVEVETVVRVRRTA